jgi:hypothetical protein
VNGFKWTSNTRVLVCIIAALLLVIWFALLQQYYGMHMIRVESRAEGEEVRCCW